MRPLRAAPAELSAAVKRSARPAAAETAAAPAAILLNAERREIFVFIILAQVEFCGEYTPRCCARVKQESHLQRNPPATCLVALNAPKNGAKDTSTPNASRLPNVTELREASGVRRSEE